MTYQDLLEQLNELHPDFRKMDVTVFNSNDGEFYPVDCLDICGGPHEDTTEAEGILDKGHPYLIT